MTRLIELGGGEELVAEGELVAPLGAAGVDRREPVVEDQLIGGLAVEVVGQGQAEAQVVRAPRLLAGVDDEVERGAVGPGLEVEVHGLELAEPVGAQQVVVQGLEVQRRPGRRLDAATHAPGIDAISGAHVHVGHFDGGRLPARALARSPGGVLGLAHREAAQLLDVRAGYALASVGGEFHRGNDAMETPSRSGTRSRSSAVICKRF